MSYWSKRWFRQREYGGVCYGCGYSSLILQFVYEKEGILVPADEPKAEFLKYHYPRAIEDDVDPKNHVLEAYLLCININDGLGILLSKPDEGSSKKYRKSNTILTPEKTDKDTTVSKSPKKQPVEVVKVSKKSKKSQETTQPDFTKKLIPTKSGVLKRIKKMSYKAKTYPERSSSFPPSMIRKPHVTRKGVVLREVPILFLTSSKKRMAEDVAKHISSKTKKLKKRKLILQVDEDEEIVPDSPLGVLNDEHLVASQGILEIATVQTDTSLPLIITSISPTTHSPTFDMVIDNPITSLFSSQSTDPPKPLNDDDTDNGGFGRSFVDLEFNLEEDDIPDHMLMFGKQFEILNKDLNFVLQS
ncbi:unnamed protein product [Lactuca saligna]|uniref:Uncharacterized protein n=1 Tax=Lactuca saligna TaxID=75948 RepID=A0AA35Z328_LACSI|nr:unnamed protein product [Lactuca saligna]